MYQRLRNIYYRVFYDWSDRRRRLIAYLLVVFAFCGVAARLDQQDNNQDRETQVRIHQLCLVFEREHLEDVKSLTRVYLYLDALPEGEKQLTFNKFILAQLPEQEKKAFTDNAPPFCDLPERGLPEPDPAVPERPKSLQDVVLTNK